MDNKYKIITAENNTLISNLIHSIDKDLLRIYNRELAVYGLTMQQSLTILYIANSDKEKVYQIDIERYLNLKNPTVTSMVKNLIANGYIFRIKDEKDGRYYHLHLTEKSLAITDELAKAIYEINRFIETHMSSQEYNILSSLLLKVADMVKEEANKTE